MHEPPDGGVQGRSSYTAFQKNKESSFSLERFAVSSKRSGWQDKSHMARTSLDGSVKSSQPHLNNRTDGKQIYRLRSLCTQKNPNKTLPKSSGTVQKMT